MKILDATFLIDYLDGVEATREFYEEHGSDQIRWVGPVPAFAEALVGEGNLPSGDVDGACADLAWVDVHPVDERTAVTAGDTRRAVSTRHRSTSSPARHSVRMDPVVMGFRTRRLSSRRA